MLSLTPLCAGMYSFFAAHLLVSCTGRKTVSSDSQVLKIWDQQSGVNFNTIMLA